HGARGQVGCCSGTGARRTAGGWYVNTRGILWLLASAACYAGLVVVWQLVADARWISPMYLPGPDRVWAALRRSLEAGQLAEMLSVTVGHMLLGWLLASLAGVAAGALIGVSPAARAY